MIPEEVANNFIASIVVQCLNLIKFFIFILGHKGKVFGAL